MRWKKKESYWLTQPIIAHGSGSAGCWKTRAREKNSRPRSRTTVFTLTDYRAIQQTRPRIAQCKPSFRIIIVQYEYWNCLLIADIPQCLIDYMSYVTQLEYDQEPDYNLLRNSLKAGMKKERLALDGKLVFAVQVSRWLCNICWYNICVCTARGDNS